MQRLISFMTLGLLLVLMSASELFAAAPSTQASNIAFSNITATGVRVVFTRGNGNSRIVVFTPVGQTVETPALTNNGYLTANTNYSSAPSIGTTSKVVYQGTLRAINVTGLTAGTEYHVKVYERNGSGNTWEYNIADVEGSNNPRTFFTNPAPPASIGAGSHDQTTNSFRANWTDPSTGGWDGFQLTVSTVNTFASALTWFSNLEVGDVNEYEVDIDLSPNTTYFYRVRSMQDARVSSWASYTSGVSTLPGAPTFSPTAVNLCLNETHIVAPTAPTPGMGAEEFRFFAYDEDDNRTWPFPLTEIDLTPSSAGDTYYYISTYSNKTGLESAERVEIIITAFPSGNVADAGEDIEACSNYQGEGSGVSTYLNANEVGAAAENWGAYGEWTVISGPDGVDLDDVYFFSGDQDPETEVGFPAEGTYVLRWTIYQTACETTFDEVAITVYEQPDYAYAGEYSDICGSLTLDLMADEPYVGIGTWSYYGAEGGEFSDVNDPEATFTAPEYGEYEIIWTVSNGNCSSESDWFYITFDETPTVADAGDDIEQCGTTSVNLDANEALVGNGVWTQTSPVTPLADIEDINDPNTSVSITSGQEGTYTFRWTISSEEEVCPSTSDDVVVTWSSEISEAELEEVGNMIGCGDMAVELWAIEPLVGEGEWSVISSPANSNYSFDYTDLANAYFEVDTYGSYTLRWTVSDPNGICPDDFVNVTISFSESPTSANAGFDKNVCGLTGALEGNEPGVGTGTWELVSGAGSVTSWDNQDPTTNVTVSDYGTYSFEWAIESGCATSSDVVNVTFWNPMNGWFAGPDVTICGTGSGNTGELLGVVPTTYGAGVYGEWTKVSGPGVPTFIDWNAYDTEVWFNLPGTYVIRWTGYNGPCTAEDEITVIVTTPPTVTFGSVTPVCETAAPIALTTGSPAGGVYSGTGVTSGMFNPTVAGLGTHTLTYTYTAGNGCSASATTVIEVTDPPTVEFDPIQPLCISANAVTLTSGSPMGGEYSGTGVVSGQFDPATAGVGTYTLTYTYSSGGCSNTATTVVTVNALPVVTWTNDLGTYCTTQNTTIELSEGSPSGGSYSGVGLSGSTNFFNPSIAGAGTHTLTYTYTDGNDCVNTATNTVVVSPPPTVTFDAIEDVCVGSESFSLISYVSPSGGTFTGSGVSGNDFNPSSVAAGTYTLTYTVTAGVCSDSETQTIIVKALPSITFESSYLAVCEDASDLDLFDSFAPSLSGGTFSGNGVSGNMFDPNGANVVIGSNTITYTATGPNGCSNSSTVTIWVDEKPEAVWSFLGDEVCVNSEEIDISHIQPVDVGPSYDYSYSISENGSSFLTGSIFTPSQAGTYTVTLTITNGECTTTVDSEIVVNPLPEVEWETTLNAVCIDAAPITLSGATPIGGTYSGTGVTSGVFTPSAAGAGTYTFTYTYTDMETGCVNTATNTIVVNPLPTVTWSTQYNAVCFDAEPITLTGGSPSGVGGVYTGAGVLSGVFNPSVAGAGTHTLTYTYTDGNGCVNTATNSIVVNPLPVVTWTTEYDAVCENYNSFSLNGGLPATGSYSGAGVTSGVFNPAVAGAGTHTLTYTYTDGNGCTNTATNSIVVNALVFADAGEDDAAELGSLTYTLDGNLASPGTGTWTKYSGPGTVITYTPNANTNNASVEVDEYGVYVFRWSITNGACTNFDDVTITFEPNDEAATKLALEIPANVVHGVPFTATIKTLNEINVEVAPDATVNFTVAKTFGNSVLTGTATGSIVPPATSATLTLTLTSADELIGEAGVELTATDNADELTDGVDVTNVLPIAPPVQATGLAFTGKSTNSLSFVWDKLDAAGAVVVGRRSALTVPNSIQLVPGTAYPGSASWGAGHQFTLTTYSVYSGAGSSLTVTGLNSVTNYAFKVFAYNGSGSLINYNNSNRSDWSNNRGTATEKDAFAAEELPLVGDNILSSSYVTPNPARDNVSLAIDLAKSASLNISFFTTDGKEVIVAVDNSMYNAGRHNFNIPLNGLAAGVYSVVIRADNEVIINNVVVMP